MKRSRFLAFIGWLTLSFLLAIGSQVQSINAQSARSTELIVSAAASIKDAMETIQPIYNKANPSVKLTYNFGSSGSLQQQIEQGAPVDIFISAAAKQMDDLDKKGLLLGGTKQNLLTNQLVLVVPSDNNQVNNFKALTGNSVKKIAMGEPESVPAGKYARETLTYLKIFDTIQPKIVYAKDVRQVLNYVATGNVDAGIVYLSDAKISDKVKVVDTAPQGAHSPIVYPIAVLKDSRQAEAAKKFHRFLFSSQSEAIFKRYGFNMVKTKVTM